MQYSDKVMDHFLHPRNVGEIEDTSGVGEVGNAKMWGYNENILRRRR